MPKLVPETRSSRKLTEYFSKQPKDLKTRRVNEIIEVSSSDRNSVISISSDGKPSSLSSLNPAKSKSKEASSRLPNSKGSAAARPVSRPRSDSRSTLSSRRSSPEPIHSSRSRSKRTLNVISAEDSSDDDTPLPAIILSQNSDLTSLTPKAVKPSRLSPFTPRQNLELPVAKSKVTSPQSLTSPFFHTPRGLAKKTTPKTSVGKLPPRHKRPRYHSPEKVVMVLESDADDENEPSEPPQSTPPPSVSTDEAVSSVDMDMDMDESNAPEIPIAPLVSFQPTLTTPNSKKEEVIPSSQHGEMEIDRLDSELDPPSHKTNESEKVTKPSHLAHLNDTASTSTLSPISAKTLSVINEIKARAEREAVLEAEKTRIDMSLGFTSEDDSDLTDLSDFSLDLNLDLSEKDKGKGKAPQPSLELKEEPNDPPAQSVRRSTRHHDAPAPNYKVKISLIRSSPPLARSSKARNPLDKIVKESGHLKAAAELESSLRASSSRATSVDIMDYGPETPSHPKFSSEGQFDLDSPLLDHVMQKTILGQEESEAVDKILKTDREDLKEQMSVRTEKFSVWNSCAMVTEHAVPSLQTEDPVLPLIASLKGALNKKDYHAASLLIDSGVLRVYQSPKLLVWLLKLVFTMQSAQLSESAHRAILSLEPEQLPTGWLDEELVHWVLQRLGLKAEVLQLLNINNSYGNFEKVESRITTISSLLTILTTVSRTQVLTEAAIPCIVTALMVLGMDSLISSSLRCAVMVAVEAILSGQSFSNETELSVLKTVHKAIVKLDFTIYDQARLLELFSGCNPVSGRVRRWIAWSMLGGDLDALTTHEYGDFPHFSDILNLFSKDQNGRFKLVHGDVDYQVLGAQTDILSVVMTDIEGYAQQPGGKEFVEETFRNLDTILGKINDTRAAHLDRSKTKDAMNRLRNRLQYQLEAAIQVLRPRKNKLDHFFDIKPKSAGVTPVVATVA